MTTEKTDRSADIVSLSGHPIHRHGEPAPWSAPQGEEFIGQISDHIEAHLGPVASVFHELVSDTVHIDVHIVMPTAACPYIRLVTSGMSDLPMSTPEGLDAPRFIELSMTLPPDWKLDQASFDDEAWYWPVRLLKHLARFPHKYQTWLGFGHTVPNGDPAEPYAPDTGFCGAIILPPLSAPDGFQTLEIPGVKTIRFYAVVPLYAKEMESKLRLGTDDLLDRFDRKGIDDVLVPGRPDVTAKRFLFW